jgi:glyoxylase-like metal-dependent hydrolase (beta-lactamase superfamily II)
MGARRLRSLLDFLLWSARRGALRLRNLKVVTTFGSDATLDVPGALRVIHTPGHTPGNTALHAPAVGALLAGDTLSTYLVTTGERGPRVAAFSAIEAAWVLPGHGAPWTDGVAAAVAAARASGIAHLAHPKPR